VDKTSGAKFDVEMLSNTAPLSGSVENLKNLEETIPGKLLKARVQKPQQKASLAKTAKDRKNLALTADLQMMDGLIRGNSGNSNNSGSGSGGNGNENDIENDFENASTTNNKNNNNINNNNLPSWRQVRVKVERPATPTVGSTNPAEEEQYLAILLVQRLLRGRAVQNTMFEGKVSERIERALRRTKMLATAGTNPLSHSITTVLLTRSPRAPCYIKNAPRFGRCRRGVSS